MRLMKLSKANSLIVNLLHSLSYGIVCGYVLMAAIWFFLGMRITLVQCCSVWVICLTVIFCVMATISAVIDIRKHIELNELARHRLTKGYDDEYFERIKKFIGGKLDDRNLLTFASMYLEGGRYEDCRHQLEKINFKRLSSTEQEEYFNVCLYSAVLEGNAELANDIYAKARRYFDRAVMGRRGGFVMHTLGMLCLLNGRVDNAYRLFQSAMRQHDDGLRCECCLGLGKVYLASGDKHSAKDMCYAAAELVESYSQAVRLKELMIEVEEAYRSKSDDTELEFGELFRA